MEQIQINIKSTLEVLKDTVDKFTKINRRDKKVLYDIYLSEYTSLIIYFEETSIPEMFKRNELKVLLNKVNDEVSRLEEILGCYSDLEMKKHQLETDFNIVEKSTVLYHHLEDLVHTMELYLGFDQTEKFRSLETMFDQVIERMKAQKKKRFQFFQNELLELKARIQNNHSEEKDELIRKVGHLINELNTSKVFNQREAFLIKQEIENKERLDRKMSLRKNILNRVRSRLLDGSDLLNENNIEGFEEELEKLKQSANDLFREY
jgi:hypothetical protein